MKPEIIFLGTSSAVPTAKRNHTSIYLRYKEENILIDCGEGTQRQLRIAKLNPCKINRILLTHVHGDHVFGLPGLFQTLVLNNYSRKLFIYGPKGTKKLIEDIFRVFVRTKNIQTEIKEVKNEFLNTKDFIIKAYELEHDTPCNGYTFIEKDKIRIDKKKLKQLKVPSHPDLSKLLQKKDVIINNKKLQYKKLTYTQKGKKISFIFDTRYCKNAKKLAENSDIAIIESTFSSETKGLEDTAKEYYHLTAAQAAKIAKESRVKKLILTHLSQRYEKNPEKILKEAKKVFPNTILAEDFMKIEI